MTIRSRRLAVLPGRVSNRCGNTEASGTRSRETGSTAFGFKDLRLVLEFAAVADGAAAGRRRRAALHLDSARLPRRAPGTTDRARLFWEATYKTVDNYDKTRAFYGCGDWHTAVGATYTLVRLLKEYPGLPVDGLVPREAEQSPGPAELRG